jgi:hypothetical protein
MSELGEYEVDLNGNPTNMQLTKEHAERLDAKFVAPIDNGHSDDDEEEAETKAAPPPITSARTTNNKAR